VILHDAADGTDCYGGDDLSVAPTLCPPHRPATVPWVYTYRSPKPRTSEAPDRRDPDRS